MGTRGDQQDQPAVLQDVQRPAQRRPEVQVHEKTGGSHPVRGSAGQTARLPGGQTWKPFKRSRLLRHGWYPLDVRKMRGGNLIGDLKEYEAKIWWTFFLFGFVKPYKIF